MLARNQIIEMAAKWMPKEWSTADVCIHEDTSDFFKVAYGDVLWLDAKAYLIRNSAREGRFGLDDEVKHWVKRAIELPSGEMRIVKLVFHEKFTTQVGGITFECFRSPRKEARILELVKNHPNFMHGFSVTDGRGNLVRILAYISGKTLSNHVLEIQQDHETYFHQTLPGVLANYIECLKAIRFLHDNGEKHGDIRRDHILIDKHSGHYRWIDFY